MTNGEMEGEGPKNYASFYELKVKNENGKKLMNENRQRPHQFLNDVDKDEENLLAGNISSDKEFCRK